MSLLGATVAQAAAIVTATAAVAIAGFEAAQFWTVRKVARAVRGDETTDWDGLVTRSHRQEERLDKHEEALEDGGLL